jgi:hypothetical protein
MYHPADVRWDVLNNIMSSYYLHNHRIFGLNALSLWGFPESNIPTFVGYYQKMASKGGGMVQGCV